MKEFIHFRDHLNTWQRLLTIIAPLAFFWLIEFFIPLIHFNGKYKKPGHAGVNLVFLCTSMIVNIVSGMATIAVCTRVTASSFGLLNQFVLPL